MVSVDDLGEVIRLGSDGGREGQHLRAEQGL